jgi:hypothetical protein
VLPDGELEVTGTTFTVSAEAGHTTRVAVQEGHVVLRIHGETAIAIGPGDKWTPNPRPAASAWARAAPPADTAPAARFEAVERTTPPPPPSAPVASAPASNPSVDFRAAMAALDVGGQPPGGRSVRELPREASSRRAGQRCGVLARHCAPEVGEQRGHEASGPRIPPSLPSGVSTSGGGAPFSVMGKG